MVKLSKLQKIILLTVAVKTKQKKVILIKDLVKHLMHQLNMKYDSSIYTAINNLCKSGHLYKQYKKYIGIKEKGLEEARSFKEFIEDYSSTKRVNWKILKDWYYYNLVN